MDPYAVLGVERSADALTIRRAYQKLARRWHPALHTGNRMAAAEFRAAAQAYSLLSDPEARERYHAGEGAAPRVRQSVRARRRATFSGPELAFSFEELVVELLPSDPTPAQIEHAKPGLDTHSEVAVDFKEAIDGVVVSLSVQRESLCEACGGQPALVRRCSNCDSKGVEVRIERARVRIPPGVNDGSRVRVSGRGNAIQGEIGDLFLTIKVRPHERFERVGLDIHGTVPVTTREAALGAPIRVSTIHGRVEVQLPKATPSGQKFRLPTLGVNAGESAGDHIYRVEIVPPDPDRGRNAELLAALEESNPRDPEENA